jgi:hypothetical protein
LSVIYLLLIFTPKSFCMKKVIAFLLISFSLSFPRYVISQNVGVGTTTPVTKFNIVGNRSNPAIPGSATGALLRLGTLSNLEGIDFGKMGSTPFSGWVQAGYNGITADPLSLQPLGGNLGIGTTSPTEKLDVNGSSSFNGNMKLQGLNLFEFGAGVPGKEVNAGKVGYNAFGQNALTFVGAGTNISNRAVYFFAEGGVSMNGPLDIGGPLKVSGNSGTAGQVLTSNGTGAPSWANSAFGNATRFGISFTHAITTGHSLAPLTTLYNLTPADVTIGANNFTINKTGLYQFDIILNSSLSIPGTYAALNFYFHSGSMNFLNDEPVNVLGSSSLGKLNRSFSFSMHITAGTVFSLGSYVALGTGGTNSGRIYCHLIHE